MENLDIQIKKLQETINVLLKRYKQAQKENEHLKSLNEELSRNIKQKEALFQKEQQKQTAENLVLLHNDDEKKNLQQKIDLYLKDIEKCLSLLNA